MANIDAQAMLKQGIRMAGESDSNATILALYNEPFLRGANTAYLDIWGKRGVKMWDDVTLDASKQFILSALTYDVSEILRVCQYIDYSADASYGPAPEYEFEPVDEDGYVVPDATASSKVYAQYIPIPAPLVNPYPVAVSGHAAGEGATAPVYVSAMDVNAMILKGMAAVRSMQNNIEDMQKYELEYEQAVSLIRRVKKPVMRVSRDY